MTLIKEWAGVLACILIVGMWLSSLGSVGVGTLNVSNQNSGIAVNDDGTDVDSWIEGDTNATLFYVNAGDDTVTADRFTHGGDQLATSTDGTAFGPTVAEMLQYSQFVFTPSVSTATTTIPAAAGWTSLLPAAGDTRSWTLTNATSSGTSVIGIGVAAGSGVNLRVGDLSTQPFNTPTVQIQEGESAILTCTTRTAATTIDCVVH